MRTWRHYSFLTIPQTEPDACAGTMRPVLNAGDFSGENGVCQKAPRRKRGNGRGDTRPIVALAAFPVCPRVSYFSGTLGNEKLFACFAPQRGPSGRVCQGRALPLERFVLQSRKIAAVFSQDVGMSNKLDVKGRKYLARGEPVQRAHGAVVAPTLAASCLPKSSSDQKRWVA